MQTAHRTPVLSLTTRPANALDEDLIVVPVFEDGDQADALGADEATGGELTRARGRNEFRGKPHETLTVPVTATGWKAGRVLFVGVGKLSDLAHDRMRRLGTIAALGARQRRVTRLALMLPASSGERAVQAAAEGLCLGNYDGGTYKSDDEPRTWVESATVRVAGSGPEPSAAAIKALTTALDRGRVLGEFTNHARALANAPGNELTPRVFAERGAELGRSAGLGVEVIDETQIAALNMGLLLGVAKGSKEPPRLLVLKHEPADAVPGVVLGLIGKGITFDTGGISIKPAENMDKMKDDMSGGAAVICALAALSRLGAPVRCIGIVPMTENMPGGLAVKPGDVLVSAEGKTVEIINTDAEGRLVLGDALWYARQLGATHLVDLATLTGACVVALGKTTSGLFGSPDAWLDAVHIASERAGDRSWPMPTFDDYKEQLKSDIADFTNTGGRAGGAITGALFIKEFAGNLPWVHMDIAGTAWAEEPKPYQPKGATGVGVRTLVELALDAPSWSASPMAG
jgi:leucyl aminopeptidase